MLLAVAVGLALNVQGVSEAPSTTTTTATTTKTTSTTQGPECTVTSNAEINFTLVACERVYSISTIPWPNNTLEDVSVYIGGEQLGLQNNFIDVIYFDAFEQCPDKDKISSLDLSHNNITHIDSYAFTSLTALKILILDYNDITFMDMYSLDGLTQLQELFLRSNEIQYFNYGSLVDYPIQLLSLTNQRNGGDWGCGSAKDEFNPQLQIDLMNSSTCNQCDSNIVACTAANTITTTTTTTIATTTTTPQSSVDNPYVCNSCSSCKGAQHIKINAWQVSGGQQLKNEFLKCETCPETVVIGDEVVDVPEGTFDSCENLRTVVLGQNVSGVGLKAFYGTPRLEWVLVQRVITALTSEVIFPNCFGYGLQVANNTEAKQGNVTCIPCSSSITLPDTVTALVGTQVEGPFEYCYETELLYVPDSVQTIDHTFRLYSKHNLRSVRIPESTSISSSFKPFSQLCGFEVTPNMTVCNCTVGDNSCFGATTTKTPTITVTTTATITTTKTRTITTSTTTADGADGGITAGEIVGIAFGSIFFIGLATGIAGAL